MVYFDVWGKDRSEAKPVCLCSANRVLGLGKGRSLNHPDFHKRGGLGRRRALILLKVHFTRKLIWNLNLHIFEYLFIGGSLRIMSDF